MSLHENAPSKKNLWEVGTKDFRRQPVICCNEENNDKLRRIVDDYRRVTIREIAEQQDQSVGTIFKF